MVSSRKGIGSESSGGCVRVGAASAASFWLCLVNQELAAEAAPTRAWVAMSPVRQRLVLAPGQLLFPVVDVLSALAEASAGEAALLQRDVGLDAVVDHFAQRPAHAADDLGSASVRERGCKA